LITKESPKYRNVLLPAQVLIDYRRTQALSKYVLAILVRLHGILTTKRSSAHSTATGIARKYRPGAPDLELIKEAVFEKL
jgi:hypothetical protein